MPPCPALLVLILGLCCYQASPLSKSMYNVFMMCFLGSEHYLHCRALTNLHVSVSVPVYVPGHAWGGQRTTPTIWVLKMGLRFPGLLAGVTWWAISLIHSYAVFLLLYALPGGRVVIIIECFWLKGDFRLITIKVHTLEMKQNEESFKSSLRLIVYFSTYVP